jgi:hypothetical protein
MLFSVLDRKGVIVGTTTPTDTHHNNSPVMRRPQSPLLHKRLDLPQ